MSLENNDDDNNTAKKPSKNNNVRLVENELWEGGGCWPELLLMSTLFWKQKTSVLHSDEPLPY